MRSRSTRRVRARAASSRTSTRCCACTRRGAEPPGGGRGAGGMAEPPTARPPTPPPVGIDWLLVIDDDVALPHGFLDRFLHVADAAGLRLAQPAHRLHSHAAWAITRRR